MVTCQSQRKDGKPCNNPVKQGQINCWMHRKTYTLQNDGDKYERLFLPYLMVSFPNYEILWQRFITPLTRRNEDGSIQLKRDIDPLLEELCMSHYSIYYHLGFSHHFYTWNGLITFQAIFFHLSASTEMVERFIFSLGKLYAGIVDKDSKLDFLMALKEETYKSKISEYWASTKSGYEPNFKRFCETGQSVNVTLHTIGKAISEFCEQVNPRLKKDFGKWQGVAYKIRQYRNILAHNPKLGLKSNNKGDILVPKHDKLKKYKLWSDVVYRNPETDDFYPLRECIFEYQGSLERNTNRLWSHLIEILHQLSRTDKYHQMIGKDEDHTSLEEQTRNLSGQISPLPTQQLFDWQSASGTSSSLDTSASGKSASGEDESYKGTLPN